MQARARVQAVQAGRVRLECESPEEACGACAGRGRCALRWLAAPGHPQLDMAHPVLDVSPLRPGDGVIIEIDDGELLRAAALAYVPPLAGLLAGPVAVSVLTPGSELAALAGAVLGLVAGWGASRAWLRRSPPRYRLRTAEAE
ncbi:MAG TPA: SoxR reducing system RseC family protein [Steroidobacteraceae bacterium]